MQDIRKMLRKQVTSALRQAMRRDAAGFSYRAKQCVLIADEGAQYRLWFDTDKGGTPNLREKATRQRREAIASDVYRAICDVEHMKTVFPGEQLNFWPDFTDDVAERRAADLLAEDAEDDAA
jgi:hypothetical protein